MLSSDKRLLLYPALLGVLLALTNTLLAVILIAFTDSHEDLLRTGGDDSSQVRPSDYIYLLLFHFINYIIIVYFSAALIGAALTRLRGGPPALFDGFRSANSNISGIVGWALISATVGPVYYSIEKFSRIRAIPYIRIVATALTTLMRGMWSIYTYFVIPTLVSEGAGPTQAIRRSKSLVRETWGEQLVSRFTFDFIVIILGLLIKPTALIIWLTVSHPLGPIIAVALWLSVMAPLILFTYAIRSIYIAVLYEYATSGVVPRPFSREVLAGNWEPRKVPKFG